MVKTIPQIYRYIYERAERATEVGPFRTWAHQFTASNLRPLMVRERPDVVVCTHAFPCGAMAEYKRTLRRRAAGGRHRDRFRGSRVSGSTTTWTVRGATDAMRDVLMARGVADRRIFATGIPSTPRVRAPLGDASGCASGLACRRTATRS